VLVGVDGASLVNVGQDRIYEYVALHIGNA
jgi:hypothetical protein